MTLDFLIVLLCLSSPLFTLFFDSFLTPFSHHLLSLVSHSGMDDYDNQRPLFYPDTDKILVCFAIDNPNSFANIHTKWVPEVEHFCPNVPFLLIATKKDLRNYPASKSLIPHNKQQIVSMEQGRTRKSQSL